MKVKRTELNGYSTSFLFVNFNLVQYTGKILFQTDFVSLPICFDINEQIRAFGTFILGLNLEFSFQQSN